MAQMIHTSFRLVMKFAAGILIVASLFAGASAQTRSFLDQWKGSYVYEHSSGKSKSGTGIVVTYKVEVRPANNDAPAIVSIEGYQTDETIICNVEASESAISFFFKSYEDGGVKNAFGVARYMPG